ncbi:MAG: hypothetical protein ACFFCW_40760 [Candidatus Hodarchaeota archaeon]
MRCPFVDRDCIQRECPGWSNGMCFVENLSLKLDTLTNLVSTLARDLSTKAKPLEPARKKQKATIVESEMESKKASSVLEPIRTPMSIGDAILSIDFGTAFSKIAVRRRPEEIALPVPLANVAAKALFEAGLIDETGGTVNEFVEESLVYLDDESRVFCGTLARNRYVEASNSGVTRIAIQNLKQLMIGGGSDLPLHSDYFPTSDRLNTQGVLATYLAYLFHLAKIHSNSVRRKYSVDIDATLRNFSMPVWEDRQYRETVKKMMKGAISKAFCLEQWLQDQIIEGVRLSELREALKEAEKYEGGIEESILGTDVTEPVAAGYNRIVDLKIEPGQPRHMFVIDAGAGSIDFAFFTIAQPRDRERGLTIHTSDRQGSVSKGVDVWDKALRSLLHKRVSERSGLRPDDPLFQIFSTKLDANLRRYKELILESPDGYPIDISPASTSPERISRKELEDSPAVRDLLSTIRIEFEKYIRKTTEIVARDHLDPNRTEFLVTGGGSLMPSIIDCIRDCVATLGGSYTTKVKGHSVPTVYEGIPNITNVYAMLAVSLGSTEREYLREKQLSPIKRQPGTVIIGGYYTKGG